MNKQQQAGKGVSGFLTGILLATAVIAAVVFMLNKSRQNDFKEQPQAVEETRTEVLTPPQSAEQQPVQTASETVIEILPEPAESGQDTEKDGNADREDTGRSAEPTESQREEAAQEDSKPAAVAPKPAAKPAAKPAERETAKPAAKPQPKPQEQKKAAAKPEPKKEVKPTAEQILESGNIEKARQKARAEQERKAAEAVERRRAEAALNGKAHTATAKPAEKAAAQSGSKVIIQAGSYGSQADAEAQRAKLAMMGVSARVAQAQVNGKTVYRVQTGALGSEAAAKARRTLQQHGIESFTRSAK